MNPSKEEINRKLLHFTALLMPLGIFYGPKLVAGMPPFLPAVLLGLLTLFSLLVEAVRRSNPFFKSRFNRWFGSMLRNEEEFKTTGATHIIAGAFLCALVSQDTPHIACMVLTAFILGDAAAALAGQRYGRTRVFGKSLEGSLACFALCLILLLAVFPLLPSLLDAWGGAVPPALALLTAAVITLLELLPIKLPGGLVLNDNLAAPVLSVMVLQNAALRLL
jgi:dolichol kinase